MSNKGEYGITDIADKLGISAATVSRALNDHPRISQKTKEKVKAMAAELNYRPNTMASSLRSKKSNTIGLIVPKISMYFHSVFISSLQSDLQRLGLNVIIGQSNDSVELEKNLVNTMYSSRVDALVISLSLGTQDYSHFDSFTNSGIPVIFFDRIPLEPYPAYFVRGNDEMGGYLAGKHLIEAGCRRIAYISGPLTCSLYVDRTNGFIKAMKEHRVSLNREWIFHHELTVTSANESLDSIFKNKDVLPDGIFACNDTVALETVKFAKSKDIRIPDDLKLVGYSNDPRTSIISPSITTIEQYPEKMALKTSEILEILLRKNHETAPPVHLLEKINVELISRDSSK